MESVRLLMDDLRANPGRYALSYSIVITENAIAISSNNVITRYNMLGKVTFALPGEANTIDYVTLLKTLAAGGYTGDICCEVSSAVWRQPQYDATVAARTCYRNMAAVFKKAGLSRR